MELHRGGASPRTEREEVRDTVIPIPGEEVRDEKVRGRDRSDSREKEERKTSRETLPKEVEE
ncbi:MAG TPA: hypothetical protein VLQ94_04815, partial [Candidatus Binatia bacterium]|nr:hypothetical protein [Candidatus Binatia bacterium]